MEKIVIGQIITFYDGTLALKGKVIGVAYGEITVKDLQVENFSTVKFSTKEKRFKCVKDEKFAVIKEDS